MPKDLNLKLLNKYGSIFADELAGLVNIEVKYGKLNIHKISRGSGEEKSMVTIGYSEGSVIDEANWLKLDIKYSKLKIATVQNLGVISKYSELSVENAKAMVISSKYDVFKIGQVGYIKGTSEYSSFSIQQADNKLELQTSYGHVDIALVPAGFEILDFNGRYTRFTAHIDPAASFSFRGSAEFAKIRIPDDKNLSRIIENTRQTFSGTVGPKPDPVAKVTINTKYGEVELVR